jgi:hypothetical protein
MKKENVTNKQVAFSFFLTHGLSVTLHYRKHR